MKHNLFRLLFVCTLLYSPNIIFGQAPDLGASETFALFTASGAFNGDAATSVVGDIGTNVGAFTPPGFLVGSIHVADPVSAQAAADVAIAYGYLAGLTCGSVLTTPLGNGQTLAPNIYCIGTAAVLNADLILDGGGDPGAIFIFQIDGALSTNPFSNVLLTNGASLCNVYWQINGALNVGGNTLFQGTVIAAGAINLANGAVLSGRGLSTAGAISTSANTVTLSNACLCSLEVTCPDPTGGTFQCIGDIPVGAAADVTVVSSCGTPTVTITGTSTGAGCAASPYVLTRTYTVTDQGGHSTACVVTYTAIDLIIPTITCPANIAVSCASNVPAASPGSVTTSDNCGGSVSVISLGDVISSQSCVNRFTITRTYRASDLCGNSATCTQTITVNDITPPSITCPANVVVSCASNVPAPTPASVTASDLCGGAVTVVHVGDVVTPGSCANRFSIARTYQATDLCGNSVICVQTITINDIAPPVITCPANVVVSCASNVPPAAPASVIASDLCGGAVTVVHVGDVTTPGSCANRFSIARTYQATDLCGNSAICVQTITVNDITLPVITCPANVVVSCANNIPPAAPASVIASDLCGGAVTVVHVGDVVTPGSCANRFSIARTYQASDLCGNVAICVQTITVNDITLPVITCPANVVVSCANNVPPAAPASVIASDLCGGTVTVAHVGDVVTPGSCANRFSIARTYQASDLCGNVAICVQTITVNDITLPVITCPANVVVSCANNVPPAAPASVIASDLCGGAVTVVHVGDVVTPGSCANRFSIARTYQATDLCGNSAICVQTITVNDITLPVITCPANVVVSCANNVPPAAPASVIASDLCGGAVTVVHVGDVTTPGSCANRFSIARTYQATDLCGNVAICVQTITVNDITPPTIICPANVVVSCAPDVPLPAPASIISSDLCGGAVTVIHVGDVTTAGICANRFTVTRTYRATDICGNFANCAQTITVNDITPPTFQNPPANITVECFLIPAVPSLPTATDNCTGPVVVILQSEIQTPGICPVLYTLTRTWRASDACGNFSTVSQVLTVVDTYAPQFVIVPADVVIECDLDTNVDAFQDWLDNLGGATVFDCSPITWSFIPSPFFIMPSTCGGTSQRFIRFIATDQCGNSAFHDAGFTIMDMTPPIFEVLPQNLSVECIAGDNGEAQFIDWFENFGYAEVSDKCGLVYTDLALISNKQDCGSTFTRTYQFRATDECGNTNFVTATFSVVDNTPPVIIKCPEGNVLLTCEFDVPAPDTAGVIAWDECGGPIKVTLLNTFTVGIGCVYWPLTTSYTYAVTDICGNVSTCYQSFQVIDSIPPIYSGPDTIAVICVADLPGIGEVAGILAPYFSDNCYQIICVNEGVTATGANWITFCIKAKDLCVNWTDKFKITFIATGGCKPICALPQNSWGDTGASINTMPTTEAITQLINKYGPVTAGKLGKTIQVSSANCLQNMLPGSGNTYQFGQGHFEFGAANECQLASPLLNTDGTLKNKLAANVMAMQLNIWYNLEFNERDLGVQALALLPSCLVDPLVIAKLETDHHSVQGLLNLSNDYLAGVGFFPPNFGAPLSNALNNLNNYWRNCAINDPCSTNTSVAGQLKTEAQEGLEAGQVQLDGLGGAGPALSLVAPSDESGFYEFSNAVPILGSYMLTPNSGNMGSLNGVTTYDLVLISKHILGSEPFNSPYKMIAADANKSGTITTFDVVELRKLILGIYDVLPDNTPWRFVDKSFVFPDPTSPFSVFFPEYKTVESIQSSQMEEDFVSVKIGDLNGTAQANPSMPATERTEGVLLFDLDNRQVNAEETFEVRMSADQAIQCYQFTLLTDGLEVLDVSGKNMNAGNFAVFASSNLQVGQPGAITTSWNLPEGASNEFVEFTLKFRAIRAGKLSEMLRVSSQITTIEAYKTDHKALSVALRFHNTNGLNISGLGFELYQNVPNPFVDKTTIGFYLPEAAPATLTMYDETGRLVYTQKGDFGKGYNAFVIDRKLLINSGSLLYKLETPSDVATKQMIQVN